jgi:sulfur-oxidizing protein SoxX
MNRTSKKLLGMTSALLIAASLPMSVVKAEQEKGSDLEQGKELAFSRSKGNCLACHGIKDGESPGNIAPPLIVMKSRFPDRKVLRDQIWDASKRNPETTMPLFGRYEILTADELEKVVDYIHTL